ncbi:phosphatidylinositol-glycan biosynthesis class F protein-like [Chenopodium quinoa]|uniref:phosphatidylinositol-glycan biosynthesis class F protein-like n=1 Tax=Chenopodium quinoa TaxID=63459 RepID=UPI000B796685|nr:phosphatidylinositol-glycan biosynthesis class F protein-like [Chenopodium quinoa]XP_021735361.1 phosphatidylinositol-glycan biosynthesis class F protein-like [Chenopodium quinoa]
MTFDIFCQFSKAVGRGLLGLLAGALVFALGAISLGAPVGSKYTLSTIKWSLLMSSLTFLPAAAIFGASWVDWQRIFVKTRPTGFVEYMVCLPAHGVIIGSWFGAWPMPLDWERPWQEWPICVAYGALLGYLIGVVASFVLYFHSRRRQCVKVD